MAPQLVIGVARSMMRIERDHLWKVHRTVSRRYRLFAYQRWERSLHYL